MSIGKKPCPGCGGPLHRGSPQCKKCEARTLLGAPPLDPSVQVQADRERRQAQGIIAGLQSKYAAALKTIEDQSKLLGWLDRFREGVASTFEITPREGSGTSEATPVVVASDWHIEEIVTPASVSGLNEFNLEIAEARVRRFFQATLNLIRNHLHPGVSIHTVVLALLGDFITNDIHGAENAEANALLPIDAILRVQGWLVSGIEFLLEHSDYEFVIPCKVGNHSRTTQTTRFTTETGHSLETLLYVYLADHFRNEPRVKFVIDNGYHTYLTVYDKTIRFHHGHAIKYGGGIGGLFIPTYKAISQWEKGRHADLDVFGHFHQSKDGGNFLCNGSLIGYNTFALSIKADFERPQQTLFLVDKKRGITCRWPILLS